jgi:hypothetical protein
VNWRKQGVCTTLRFSFAFFRVNECNRDFSPTDALAFKLIRSVTLEETNCFKMLDGYSRTRHRCFLAEMDLNVAKAHYTLCFRPAAISKDSPNRDACLYLHIAIEDVKKTGQEQVLPHSVTQMLDKELPTLPQS